MARIYPSPIVTGEHKRIMVYSHDAFGLGNVRRMLTICQYLLESIPNVSNISSPLTVFSTMDVPNAVVILEGQPRS